LRRRIALVAGLVLAHAVSAQTRKVSDAEVAQVHRSLMLIDTHNDVTIAAEKGLDIGMRRDKGHTDVPRLREGGVDAVFFAAYVAGRYAQDNRAALRTLEMIDIIRHDIVERRPNDLVLALTADDIEKARAAGKIAALIGIEGGYGVEDSLRPLRGYYALGARYMTLTHSDSHRWATSSGGIDDKGPKRQGGLTDFGREVIREMNRLGMMVDVSHASDQTFWDVIKTSRAPVLATHSSCRALSNIARNMTDEMIVAMAKKGGVIQINFGCEFLSQKSADGSPWTNLSLRAKWKEGTRVKVPPASLDDLVAHIGHVVKIAGIDAVGLGSDFDGISCSPVGLEDVSKFPNLTRALLERGYAPDDIRKIYGGNLLRLMRAVERVAKGH